MHLFKAPTNIKNLKGQIWYENEGVLNAGCDYGLWFVQVCLHVAAVCTLNWAVIVLRWN